MSWTWRMTALTACTWRPRAITTWCYWTACGWSPAAPRGLQFIGNATRYAAPGSTLRVQIERLHNRQVAITVLNQGVPIAPAHLPRLFDRFYRADPARAHGDRNHGLGLSIVAAIARLHDGQTFAASSAGVTRMGLTLASAVSEPQQPHSA
jgi:two-component system heavy metal sensor histidine kinase CusS